MVHFEQYYGECKDVLLFKKKLISGCFCQEYLFLKYYN